MDGKVRKTVPAAVRRTSLRALVTACVTVITYALAYALGHYHLSYSQASFILSCVRLTAAAAAERRPSWLVILCYTVLEAVVGALALWLPCRRRALAYLKLALAVVRHCMYAHAISTILAANPGSLFGRMSIRCILCFTAQDLVGFVDLLRSEECS